VPLLVGPLLAVALGSALAWLCRAEALREDEAAFRARARVAALFAALVYAPACAYFVVFAGDWALFYLVDSAGVPSAVELCVVVADAALVVLGFAAGHHAARRRMDRALAALVLAPLAAAAAMLAAFQGRLRVEGTFHQVTSRFGTQPVAGGPLGWAILGMGAMIVAGFVIAARTLTERPRLARPPAPPSEGPKPLLGRSRRA
jgi:hypothetical protein